MKIRFFLSFLFLLMTMSYASAQIVISEEDVPQDVFVSFKYKYPDASITSWETAKGNFLARFVIVDQKGSAEFTANGKWMVSRFEIVEKELPSPIYSYYKANYKSRDFTIASSELVKTAEDETYYYIVTKKSGINQPKPSELFFDLSGKHIKTIEPEENKFAQDAYVENNTQVTVDTTSSQPAMNVKLTKKELPTNINEYLKQNYPEHAIKEASYVHDADLGDVYYLIMKQAGIKDEVQLFFDINGALVKKVDQGDIRVNVVQNDQQNQNNQQNDQQVNDQNNTEKHPTAEELRKQKEGEPIADTKVPEVAKTHFASKNRKATNVQWYLLNDNYIARFEMTGKKAFSTYDEDGVWKETRSELDVEVLTPVILSYMKSNFRKFRTIKAQYVLTAPRYKSYDVHIVEKNNKTENPPVTKVFFDGNGKYVSMEKPEIADPDIKDQQMSDEEFKNMVDGDNNKIEKGTGVNEEIKVKELPTAIINYVKKNYPEHMIKESRYLFDDDLNANVYYVTVKKEGDKYEIELYFSLSGKFLKKIDPTEQKFNDENNGGVKDEDNSSSTNLESESIDPSDLPYVIKNYLKDNYPDFKVSDASYLTDEEFDNVYYVNIKRQGAKSYVHLWFDLNGKLVKTERSED